MAAESYKGTHGREQGFRLDNTRQGRQFLYNNAAPVARIPAIRAPDTGNRADSAERQGGEFDDWIKKQQAPPKKSLHQTQTNRTRQHPVELLAGYFIIVVLLFIAIIENRQCYLSFKLSCEKSPETLLGA